MKFLLIASFENFLIVNPGQIKKDIHLNLNLKNSLSI